MVYLLNIPWIVIQKLYHECIPFDSLVRILVNFLPIFTTTAAQAAGTKFGFRSVAWTQKKGAPVLRKLGETEKTHFEIIELVDVCV